MAITRVFRVRIVSDLRADFEEKFEQTSVREVKQAAGLQSVAILRPTRWSPDEYSMIPVWEGEESLQAFAGDDLSRAVIPIGMEHFVVKCWAHHFHSWAEQPPIAASRRTRY
jgi:heme-degrading monooxygenase HmoA